MTTHQFDYVIIGSGIVGLTIARSLMLRNFGASIAIFEKEDGLGFHASGRNSGVMHSGVYYKENSLKAKFCAQGSRFLIDFCEEFDLPTNRMGKVIVPTECDQDSQVDLLYKRGVNNGAKLQVIDAKELKEIEPEAATASGRALYLPNATVIDSVAVLKQLKCNLMEKGVKFFFSSELVSANPDKSEFTTKENLLVNYGKLFNTAGQHADKIAHLFRTAEQYTLLPFKGMYFSLKQSSNIKLNGLIYPVPDLNVPFLGVHSVKKVTGEVYFGPTAVPALGRENYYGLKGLEPIEAARIFKNLSIQYWKNSQGFRNYAHEEAGRFLKARFAAAAKALVPKLETQHLMNSKKVGIRAQLLNTETKELEMDFLIHKQDNTVHVLNAVSPAFTCSIPFAEYVVNDALDKQ